MGFRFEIKAQPNAPRSEVLGWMALAGGGEALKVKIKAPPVEGKANEALCELIAEKLGLPRRAVSVLRGDKSRLKLVEVAGLPEAEVRRLLAV